jgi:hypothetical protein
MALVQRWLRGPESPDFPIPAQILTTVVLLWLPLVLLSLFEGSLSGMKVAQPLMSDIVPHVRFLIAIPLLLVADLAIDPAIRSAIRDLESSGAIPSAELPRFQMALTRMRDARDSGWPDVMIVLLAFGFTWLFKPGYGDSALEAAATSWLWAVNDGDVRFSAAGWWYLLISGPMFQVILFRWFWRFFIWAAFLFRISRLPLTLRPTDPDLAGGLGYLGVAQQSFTAVFFAFATVASSTVAHDILSEGSTLRDASLEIIVLVIVLVVTIYAPLLLFSGQLFIARRAGLKEYGWLAYKLSEAFHEKWITEDKEAVGKALLASTDASAMADYSATYDNVRSMRLVPATMRSVATVAGILLVPFLPLVLTEFSIQDLFNRLTDALV